MVKDSVFGLGFVCAEDLEPGDVVLEYVGTLRSKKKHERGYKNYKSFAWSMEYALTMDNGTVVDAKTYGSKARCINASCEPNCRCETVKLAESNHCVAFVFASEFIPKGKPPYAAYNTSGKKRTCKCGINNCCGKN